MALNPESLAILRQHLGLGASADAPVYSDNLMEADPSLAVTADHAHGENSPLLKMLYPDDPTVAVQQKMLQGNDQRINDARLAEQPDIKAEADAKQAEQLALAHAAPGGLDTENAKAAAARQSVQDMLGRGAQNGVTFKPNINAQGQVSYTGELPPKLTNAEQAQVDAVKSIHLLGEPLLTEMEQRFPDIATNPEKYGSIGDTLTEKFGKGVYSFGAMTSQDPLYQKIAAVQAWALRQQAQGRINKTMMDIINQHLPQPGFSLGANYTRLRTLLSSISEATLGGLGSNLQDVQQQYGGQGQP